MEPDGTEKYQQFPLPPPTPDPLIPAYTHTNIEVPNLPVAVHHCVPDCTPTWEVVGNSSALTQDEHGR